jgi:hypothetical protein
MIESTQYKAPKSSLASGMRDVQNTIVDSGYRFGKQIYRIFFHNPLNVSTPTVPDLDTNSNGLSVDVAGTTVSAAFNTDTDTTIGDFVTALIANANIQTASVKNYEITIEINENSNVLVKEPLVTGANKNTTAAISLEQDLRIIPAIVTINAEPEALRIDDNGAGLVYTGYADLGTADTDPLWRIKRIQTTGDNTVITYADGDRNFDNVWDDRDSLTYA